MRLYLTHRPDSGATEVRVEVDVKMGRRVFSIAGWPEPFRQAEDRVLVEPGTEPPLYCPPIPDAEMARMLGIRP